MNDGSKIIITAGLKVSDTVEQIKKDLKSVEAQLNQNVSLDLIAGIRVDKKSIEKATKEINSIGTNDTGKAVINTLDKIGDAAERNAKRIKVISKSLANVGTEYLQQIPYIDNNGLKKNNDVLLGDLKKQLSPLGSNVSVKGIAGENANGFDYITATVKNAAGEMRTFTFAVDEAEQSYKYLSSTFNDKGIERVNKEVLKLTKQFAEFKSSHRAIQSGLTEPMKEFENVLEKINNGNGSVEELQKAYNNLAITASNIGINLGTKNKGFNIFDNAVNDSKSFETRLKKIKNEIYSFSDDYDKQRTELLRRAKEIEYQVATSSDGVYDEEWSKEYNKISESLKILETDLKNVKTEEKEYLKLLKEEQDQNAKNKKYIQNTQHEYWQGRFVDSIQNMTAGNSELELLKEQLLADDKAAKEFTNTYTKLQRQINGRINTLDTQYNSVPFKNNTSNTDVIKQRNSIEQTVNSYRLLLNELNSTTEPKALIDIIEKIQKIEPEFIKVSSANKTLQNELRSSNSLETFNNRIEKLKATMSSYAAENERAVNSTKLMPNGRSFMQEWNLMSNALKKDITPDDLKHLTERMAIFGKTAQAAGLSGETAWQKFLNTFKTFSTYISANMIFSYIRRTVTDMVQEVISMDSAMTELRKVTEATEQQFYKFSETAAKTGKELGASITDIINATSVFSRAGYGLEDAEKLGEIATLYKNVGDGITIDNAAETIVSTMKAFNIEAQNSEMIIDKINKVSNEAAIESGGLGEAIKRVASAMASANNSLDDTISLITVANEITQDPTSTAQAWRTVSMRLRGAKSELQDIGEDTEGLIESTAKLQGMIKSMTGVDIMIDNNTFKSTTQIIRELGAVWEKLSDIQQAELLEAIAGKRQANVVAGALRNYERLDEILEISRNSYGSAREEQERYTKSIQYSVDVFKTSYQDLSRTIADKDTIKGFLDTSSTILDILETLIDKLGLVPTLVMSVGTALSFTNKGMYNLIYDNGFKGLTDLLNSLSNYSNIKQTFQKFDIDLTGLNDGDIANLQEYINLIKKGVDSEKAWNSVIKESSISVQDQAEKFKSLTASYKSGVISEEEYTIATQNLSRQQKIATASTKALNIATNMFFNLLATAAVTLIISAFQKLSNAEQEALENMQEYTQKIKENVDKVNSENEYLQKTIDKYTELYTSTTDINNIKGELIEIEDELLAKYGYEAEALDNLNGKYSTYIENLNKERLTNAQQFVNDNKSNYILAKQRLNGEKDVDNRLLNKRFEFTKLSDDEATNLLNLGLFNDNIYASWINRSVTLSLTAKSYEEYFDALEKIVQAESELDNYNNNFRDKSRQKLRDEIAEYKEVLKEQYEQDSNLVRQYENYSKTLNDLNSVSPELQKEFNAKIDELTSEEAKLNELINNGGSQYDIETQRQKVIELKEGALEVAGTNKELRDIVFGISDNTDSVLKYTNNMLHSLKQDFDDFFDKSFDKAQKNISKVQNAIQKIANGDNLTWDEANEIIFQFDSDRIVGSLEMVDGMYRTVGGDVSSLIKLKDSMIEQNKQEIVQEREKQKEVLKLLELRLYEAKVHLNNVNSESDAIATRNQIKSIQDEIDSVNSLLNESNMLIQQCNSQLGYTINKAEAIEKLQKKADEYAKAMTGYIDDITDGLNGEKEVLDSQKTELEEQLKIYEEQIDKLEETIKAYDTLANLVEKQAKEQTDLLKEQQKVEEEAIQKQIDALKEKKDEQDEQTNLAEKELEVKQKLADLEKARNKRVRTYSAETGWTWGGDKEAVANAQKDYDDAKKSYDKAIDDKNYNDQIKALEKQKDAVSESYESQIKEYEDYIELWKGIEQEQSDIEAERLAEQMFGSDWREKISNKDMSILSKYKSYYTSYNNQLNSLTNNEIKSLKNSIKAKEDEIQAKEKQIEEWNKYKSTVEKAIKSINDANNNYVSKLEGIKLTEQSSLEERSQAFENFKNHYQEITDMLNELDNQDTSIRIYADLDDVRNNLADFIEDYRDGIEAMQAALGASSTGFGVVNSDWDAKLAEAAKRMRYYSSGGVADYTGTAMLHGKSNASEVIFNSAQAKSLYDMVRNDEFSSNLAKGILETLSSHLNSNTNTNTNNSSVNTININGMTIKTDNPQQFHDQFMTEIGKYWNVKLTESRVR